jgi:hypothetical protein
MMTGVVVVLCSAVMCIAILYLLLDMMKVETKYIVMVFFFIAGVAVITNPKVEQHAQSISKIAMERSGNDYTSAGGALAVSLANNLISSMIDVDNYVLFSLTKMKSKIVGVGAFGNVWIFEN